MLFLRRARVPLAVLPAELSAGADDPDARLEPWRECDLTIKDDRIADVRPSGDGAPAGATVADLGGALVFPGLLDAHTHLDKCHTWDRAPNPRGLFGDALEILHRDSERWTEQDLHRRASFGLQQAWAHGTVALRTHVDSDKRVSATSHAVMQQLASEWRGRIELQTVSLCSLAHFAGAQARAIMDLTARHHAAALGGFPQPGPDLPRQLDRLMAAARELGVGLDLHVDESGLPEAECLRAVAEAVLRNEFALPVVCGHCCSLAVQPPERQRSTLDLVRRAGVSVIALPLCNLYLQGREAGRTPTWRGLTTVHELRAAGVTVAAASDNVRDAFYAWGDFDVLEVLQQTVRIGHLDTALDEAVRMVTTAPARIMGLPEHGRIAPGAPARLIVTEAPSFNHFLARPAAPRRLVRGERWGDASPPPFSQLAED